MKKNDLFRKDNKVLRVIHIQENRIMVIDCIKCTMPVWINPTVMCMYAEYAEEKYYSEVAKRMLLNVDFHAMQKYNYKHRCQ